ncbi:MAG: hypothetical protein KGK10_10595 [Rhodospirillales bacterium]|nr:hypothetical protein [Rhodospirillales bacterium]
MNTVLAHASEQAGERAARRLAAIAHQSALAQVGRRVLLLRLSRLPRDWSRPHHLRLAREAVSPLTLAQRAELLDLPNRDLAIVWRGEAPLEACLRDLGALFEGAEGTDVADLYDLPQHAETVAAAAAASLRRRASSAASAAPPPRLLLDAERTARLEAAIGPLDIGGFVRASALADSTPGTPGWTRLGVDLPALLETLLPGADIAGSTDAARRLRAAVAERLLVHLEDEPSRPAGPLALTLPPLTVLGPGFRRFDAALPAAARGEVLVGFDLLDVAADPPAYLLARERLHGRGHMVLMHLPEGIATEAADLEALAPDRIERVSTPGRCEPLSS